MEQQNYGQKTFLPSQAELFAWGRREFQQSLGFLFFRGHCLIQMCLVKRNKGYKYPRNPSVGMSMWRCLGLVQARESKEIHGKPDDGDDFEAGGREKIRAHRRTLVQPKELDTGRNRESPRTLPGCLGQMVRCWTQVWDVTSKEDAKDQHFSPGKRRQATEEPLGSKLGQGIERVGGFSEKELRVLLSHKGLSRAAGGAAASPE